jgi:hypothetical protein
VTEPLLPQTLLAQVHAELEQLLQAIRRAAEPTLSTSVVPDLPPPFTGRLLVPASSGPSVTGNVAAKALLDAIKALELTEGSWTVKLFGLGPPPGRPAPPTGTTLDAGNGLALVLSGPTPTGGSLPVVALGYTVAGFELLATDTAYSLPPTTVANAAAMLSVKSTGSVVADLLWPPGQGLEMLAGAAPEITARVVRSAPLTCSAPGVTVSAAGFTLAVDFSTASPSVSVMIPQASLELSPSILTALLGAQGVSVSGAVTLTADAGGLRIGGGLSALIPVTASVPGITVSSVEVALAAGTGGAAVSFGVTVRMTVDPPLPVNFDLGGLGANLPTLAGPNALGLNDISLAPPTAIGADLDLGPISGGGYLAQLGPDSYGGLISIRLGAISVQAYGLLQTEPELSMVVLLSVRFPPPGIQLSFGFSLNAVGGIVGINRRIDRDALTQAVLDGTADALLLPPDPAHNAPAIVQTLASVFPVAPGAAFGGPLIEIGWGGRLVTATVGVIVEVGAGAAQIVVVGRVRIALPDPDVPLVLLQATVAGDIDLGVPSVEIVATLNGSEIAGVKLSGDMYLLVRGGSDPVFVMSVGGFHPRYRPPAGTPALRRLIVDLCPLGLPSLIAELYLAITANSVQLGAQLTIAYEIDDCGVSGTVGFDAIVEWSPQFFFTAEIYATVAVKLFGKTLMGISLDFTLSGPGPWHAHGTASVSILFFSASLDFSVTWGAPQPSLGPADVAGALQHAFAEARAWRAEPPAGAAMAVVLSGAATTAADDGSAVHPLGGLIVRQTVVPLGLSIDRFLNAPVPAQLWQITAVGFAADALATVATVQDEFAPGAFLSLTADDQLSRPDYELLDSGTTLASPGGVAPAAATAGSIQDVWVTYLITAAGGPAVEITTPGSDAIARDDAVAWAGTSVIAAGAESALAGGDIHGDPALWTGGSPLTFAGDPAYVLADTDTLEADQAVAPASYSLLAQQLGPGLQVVERWETVIS